MTRFSTCFLLAGVIFAGLAANPGHLVAADLPTSPVADATPAMVSAITPVNLAGALNYCVEGNYVAYDDGFSTLNSLNHKTDAVPSGNSGNMDYAYGTAGQFFVSGKAHTFAVMPEDARQKLCGSVLARAKTLI